MLICLGGFCPVYSFSLFLPTIIRNMGYSANNAQLMSTPPYVLACLFAIAGSQLADRCRQRGVFLLGFQLIAILGLAMLAASENPTLQYTGTVLAAIGKLYPIGRLIRKRYETLIDFFADKYRNLPPDPARSGVEREQHRRQPQARNWNRYAGDGR